MIGVMLQVGVQSGFNEIIVGFLLELDKHKSKWCKRG